MSGNYRGSDVGKIVNVLCFGAPLLASSGCGAEACAALLGAALLRSGSPAPRSPLAVPPSLPIMNGCL